MQSQLQRACFAAALLCCALAQDGEVNCKGMRVKELRQFLSARGVKCEGCAEKADFLKLCEEHADTPVLPPKEEEPTAPAEKEKDVEDILKNLKGMPGMDGIKMFSGDDLKNMNYEQMGNMFGGGGGGGGGRGSGGRPKPRKTRSQHRRELVEFYKRYAMDDKIDGVDAALDKWKGREEKMFTALHKKYDDDIKKYWEAQRENDDAAAYDEEISQGGDREEEEAMDKAFGSASKDEV